MKAARKAEAYIADYRFPYIGDPLKVPTVVISIVALLGSSLACGQGDTQAAESRNLNRAIPRLPNGLSVEEVEAQLGQPQDRIETEGSEVVLPYGLWEVVFDPRLYKRTRYYRAGYWPADKPVAPLDRQVRELSCGISKAAVEHELGKTEAWQVLDFNRWERIWYGNGRWKLSLRDKELSKKQKPDNKSRTLGSSLGKRKWVGSSLGSRDRSGSGKA